MESLKVINRFQYAKSISGANFYGHTFGRAKYGKIIANIAALTHIKDVKQISNTNARIGVISLPINRVKTSMLLFR